MLAAKRIGLGKGRTGVPHGHLARLGQLDGAGRAAKELDAQLALEPAHLGREGGLGDVELLGGPGEVAMARDRLEVSELAKLHSLIIAYCDESCRNKLLCR